jgi:TolB-like protein/Flp pilus assembly protein TadD
MELRKDGRRVRIQEQPLRILGALIQQPKILVTRGELRQLLWPLDVYIDFDFRINKAVNKLREALNDSHLRPRYVETVPRRGYRFVGDLDEASQTVGFPQLAQRPRLIVLPFSSCSGNPEQEHFLEGLLEELIACLGHRHLNGLGIIALTTARKYKADGRGVDEIRRELAVDYVLESCVRKADNRVRIFARLVRTQDQTYIWTQEYDNSVENVLAIQSEVADDIAKCLASRIASRPVSGVRNAPIHTEALDAYLRGRHLFEVRTLRAVQQAIACFERAIAREPSFALAYAALADCYLACASWSYSMPTEAFELMRAAALRAVELNDTLAEAHTMLAMASLHFDWDWEQSEREFQKALSLNPNYAPAHQYYAFSLMPLGRTEEALAEIDRARELDPLEMMIQAHKGWLLRCARRTGEAIEMLEEAVQNEPQSLPAHLYLGIAYSAARVPEGAIAELETSAALSGRTSAILLNLGIAYAIAGRSEQARGIIAELHHIREIGSIAPFYWEALIHAVIGKPDDALDCLERSADLRENWAIWLNVEPLLDPLRSEPRFQRLLQRIGLWSS